jgi:hypothetical protein
LSTKSHLGLDDYPRGQLSEGELHLDLTCWVGMLSKVLIELGEILHKNETDIFRQIHTNILNNIDGAYTLPSTIDLTSCRY